MLDGVTPRRRACGLSSGAGLGGGGGEGGGEGPQQAAAQLPESETLFFVLHRFEHFFGVPPLHHLLTLFLSFFLHVFLIASALQFFSDSVGGLVTSARPFRISEMSPATSPVADGAAAMAQLSTLRAASRHARYGTLSICVDDVCVRFG